MLVLVLDLSAVIKVPSIVHNLDFLSNPGAEHVMFYRARTFQQHNRIDCSTLSNKSSDPLTFT